MSDDSRRDDPPRRPRAPREEAPANGPDRILRFADSLQESRAEETVRRQQLETWVTCRVEHETYALPVGQVQEILRVGRLTRVPHAPHPVRGVTNLRGQVLPVVDLRVRLGLAAEETRERHRVMVVASRGRLIGLLVDGVDQVLQIDRLEVEEPPADVMTARSYYIQGVIHQEDRLLILLDPDRVLEVREVDDAAMAEGEPS